MAIDWNIVDDELPPAPAASSDALDGRRIHAIVLERRAAHRARLRAVLVPVACLAVAMMATTQAWAIGTSRFGRAVACGSIAVAAVWIGVRSIRSRPSPRVPTADEGSPPAFDALPDARSAAERLTDLDS